MTTLLQGLAVFDLLRLCLSLPISWIKSKFLIDLNQESEYLCEWHDVFTGVSLVSGSWAVVAITFFRLISISFPHKAKVWCTQVKARIAICFCVLIGLTLHLAAKFKSMYGLYKTQIIDGKQYTSCIYEEQEKTLSVVMFWLWIIVSVFAPFLCILMGNVFIIMTLYSRRKRRQNMMANASGGNSINEQSMSAILIAISFMFLITMMPNFLINLLKFLTVKPEEHSMAYQVIFDFVLDLLFLLTYVNNVGNIVCYSLVGSTFKAELKSLFGFKKRSTLLSTAKNMTKVSNISQSLVTQ